MGDKECVYANVRSVGILFLVRGQAQTKYIALKAYMLMIGFYAQVFRYLFYVTVSMITEIARLSSDSCYRSC